MLGFWEWREVRIVVESGRGAMAAVVVMLGDFVVSYRKTVGRALAGSLGGDVLAPG